MRSFFKKYRTILIILLVVVVGAAFVIARMPRANTTSSFQTSKLERGNLTATIGATGTVRARQTAVLTWQAAGTVDTVNVKVGDNVPANFVMAFLSKTSLPQTIISAEGDLASAQKDLDNLLNSDTARAQASVNIRDAQTAYDKAFNWRQELNGRIRQKKIIWRKIGPHTIPFVKEYKAPADQATITKADEDLAVAKAKLDDAQREFNRLNSGNMQEITAAQARVNAAQATLNMARVAAPFAGTVTEAHPLAGDQVSAGDAAFRVDNLSSLLVDVKVSEVDINSVNMDQEANLSFDAILGKEYHGKVVDVSQAGTADQGVVNFTVTVELIDADAAVKPGMTAAVNVIVNEIQAVLLVPNRAVRLQDGKRIVYILQNNLPVKKEVTLGASSDIDSVVTGGDLKEGDAIILNPPASGGGPFGGR